MSNFISPISWLPQEMLQYIRSFNPLSPARDARVSHQFHDVHTDLLRRNIRQIFEHCSIDPATLNVFINSLKERCQIADSQGNYPDLDAAGVNKLHQLIVQKIQNFGIACPNKYLSPQEIHGYSVDIAAIEDRNLQRAWDKIFQGVMEMVPAWAAPLNPPAVDASAAAIRSWMNANAAVLQHVRGLNLSGSQLTCIPREIALLTELQWLYLGNNQIRELPVGIFNELVGLQWLYLGNNQIRELPVEIFNELVRVQWLFLGNNQISELPVEIFNGLVGLQELYLHGNPRLLVFYKELQTRDFNSCRNIFNSFRRYVCRSAFAKFYQFAAQESALEKVIAAFHTLDQTTKNAIYGMVYEEAGRPTTDDLRWGEHHAFDDKGIFNGALKRYVRGRFNALSESQKNVVYGRIRELAQADPDFAQGDFSNPNWGRDHAEDNVLRLIDAMMATAP